ncbi:FAD/NAD(P)-binding domain-containing protein [Amylocystis lapponica]|nr:FAD/NAD(P)-binding domain-containing protein [Amylocystis lapponica]
MKVAVVGSGVSGLAATWLLNEYTDHEVHLYEADLRPGGHANTVTFTQPGKQLADVDTGFIVFNPSTYPNFLRFLDCYPSVRERIRETPMTFSVSRDAGGFEWAGNNLKSVFCQPSRLLDPRMWRMLYDILRFNACARIQLTSDVSMWKESIGTYLDRKGYSRSFRENYLIPMTAAIWSTPSDLCDLDFPASTLIQFMHNHHLLQITGKPSWLTLHGGSRTYVEQILSKLPSSQLHLGTAIHSIASAPKRGPGHGSQDAARHHDVQLTTASGECISYDHIILACHSDTALSLLHAGGGITADEDRILSEFQWRRNKVALHCDERLMPVHRSAWSCWNYLTTSGTAKDTGGRKLNADNVSVYVSSLSQTSHWMNALQHLSMDAHGPVFVTLNPPIEPDSARVVGRYKYEHPVLDTKAVAAQREMPAIQDKRGISFAGAWLKYGFHEDGFTSGLRAAAAIANTAPFEILDADRTPRVGVGMLCLASFFDVVEYTGLRAVIGLLLRIALFSLRTLVMVLGVDLGDLQRELSS